MWIGKIFIDAGWMIYAGGVGKTTLHRHLAYQIACEVAGPFYLSDRENLSEVTPSSVAVIAPNVDHAMVQPAPSVLMLYIGPETTMGRRLKARIAPSSQLNDWWQAGSALQGLRLSLPNTFEEAEALKDELLERLVGPSVRPRVAHPAILKAVRILPTLIEQPIHLEQLAAEVGLSAGRLSHIFRDELDIPFRAYVLWLRLQTAARMLGQGETATAAAHQAGFADSPHLTRTFRRMLGITPSELQGIVQWNVR